MGYKIDSVLLYLGGLYDTWACGGGDMRLIERVELGLNPYLLAQYLLRAPFGSSGWIISINNMEDLIGGHYWVSFYLILGSCWHIQTRALKSQQELLHGQQKLTSLILYQL